MLGFIKKQSKLNKILILVALIILILMIATFIIYYLFIGKKTVEIYNNQNTSLPTYSVGGNYLEQPGNTPAVSETPPESYDILPSSLPNEPPAPNKTYDSKKNSFPVAPPPSN